MSSMSNYLENKLIDWLFRGVAFTPPTHLYIALLTSAPSDVDTGATIAELTSTGGYARTILDPSTTNWAATNGLTTTTNPSSGTGGTTANNVAINFPQASANWSGVVTHFAIVDSATIGAGNVLFYAPLAVSKTVTNQDTFSFPISQLTAQIDN